MELVIFFVFLWLGLRLLRLLGIGLEICADDRGACGSTYDPIYCQFRDQD